MTLSKDRQQREQDKFIETSSGNTAVRVVATDGEGGNIEADKLHQYKLSDIEEGAIYTYIGYLDKSGKWYIMRIESDESFRYVKGDSGYDWSNRASETYDTFSVIF